MSIAHSRANDAWSTSSTSSLNPCSPPSGIAINRTGRSKLDSHDAALVRLRMCSMFTAMSALARIPRTVGIRPTAV
jgi:hypothetical protein